jgi:quinol monooxygenase YgiN
MRVVYTIEFHLAAGQRDRFLRLLGAVLDAMRHEDGFETATLSVDPGDENHFFLHEGWRDHQEVLDVQVHRPYRAEWHAALADILDRPRQITVWHPLRSDHA